MTGWTAAGSPDWAQWERAREAFTVGIEEEAMLLEPGDLSLVHEFDAIRKQLSPELAERLTPETHGASVELGTQPHARVADALAELNVLRARLVDELALQEVHVAAAGTHPFATWTETEISEGKRYRYVYRTMRELARREPTHALHVHVAISEAEEATTVANRMRAHLPLLLAISANSPFWQGRDSGLASSRTPIWGAFPRVGIPRRFADYGDYVETLRLLIECGAIPEPTLVWWDLRLQPRYGTIEIRIMDSQTETWRSAALAAFTQCLVRLEALEGYAAEELVAREEVLEENRFLACRDGVEAKLIDPRERTCVPAREQAKRALAACAPHAAELACERELHDVERILERPGDMVQREIAGPELDFTRLLEVLRERFASAQISVAAQSPPKGLGVSGSR
ncbi:MAG TPA: YbdK family carboxylate-amine ligase [Solirubrobacterales bacterium]|nr:YbdK family carboxylate-amine ligase [Solirubrobacterales bacterium]